MIAKARDRPPDCSDGCAAVAVERSVDGTARRLVKSIRAD
jgi:hypothetical protein